jgi:hypothetical protein
MAGLMQFGSLGRLAIALALASVSAVPARAAKNSAPAQVIMVATMPATFSLQAAQATVSGAAGTVQVQSGSPGRLLIQGQLRGQGSRTVVRIPLSLAANTRTFVVQALTKGGASHAIIHLAGPEIMTRPAPLGGQTSLAMGLARNHGGEFFTLNHPLHSTLEIIFEDLPREQTSSFSVALSMRELGY